MSGSAEPTDVGFRILGVPGDRPNATARTIHNAMLMDVPGNDSNAVKMLAVMLDRSLVKRDDRVRPQTFTARVTRRKTQMNFVARKAFAGSVASLAMQALTSGSPFRHDLDEIRMRLDRLEEK